MAAYLTLVELGAGYAVVHFVARYRSADDDETLHRFVSSMAAFYVGLGCLVATATALIAPWLATAFRLSSDTGPLAIALVGLMVGIGLSSGFATSILQGYQRHDVASAVSICAAVGAGVGTVVVLELGFGVVGLLVLGIAQRAAVLAYSLGWLSRRRLLLLDRRLIGRDQLGRALAYSKWSFLVAVSAKLSFDATDTIVISRFLSFPDVAVYAIAIAPITLLVYRTVDVFLPVFAASAANGDEERVRSLFDHLLRGAIILASPFLLLLWCSGRDIIELWIGSGYTRAFTPMLVLSLAYLGDYVAHVCGIALLGIGRHKHLGWITPLQALLNLGCSLALIQPYGVTGVTTGSLVSIGLVYCCVLPIITSRTIGAPVSGYLRAVGAPLAVAAAVALGWAILPLDAFSASARLALNALVLATVYPLLVWRFSLRPAQRVLLLAALRRFVDQHRLATNLESS